MTQVLVNIGIFPNFPGMWYYKEEIDYLIEEQNIAPEEILLWGTYGKDGKQPLKRILIKDMETDHLEACLENCPQMGKLFRETMEKVLSYRLDK